MAGIPLLGVLGLPWSQNAISGGGYDFLRALELLQGGGLRRSSLRVQAR